MLDQTIDLKVSANKHILILPNIYTFWINQRIAKATKWEKKTWYKVIDGIAQRSFCYHSRNLLFEEREIENLINWIRNKSESEDSDFCQIYADPKSYVRPFDSEQLNKTYSINSCPAYIASQNFTEIPSRIKDSEIISITLENDIFEKFYKINTIKDKIVHSFSQDQKEFAKLFESYTNLYSISKKTERKFS